MTIEHLSDSELLISTRDAIGAETVATTNVVRHFREIFDRELHLARGYSSMFVMAVKEFGYDKASAHRRVKAMELSLAEPLVLQKIDEGRNPQSYGRPPATRIRLEFGSERSRGYRR